MGMSSGLQHAHFGNLELGKEKLDGFLCHRTHNRTIQGHKSDIKARDGIPSASE